MEFLILMVQWEEEITIKVQDTDLANISLSTSLNYLVSNLSRTAGREKLLKTMSRVCNFSTFLKMSAMTYDLLFQSMKSEALFNRVLLITNSKYIQASRVTTIGKPKSKFSSTREPQRFK